MAPLLEYRRSTKAEGLWVLLSLAGTLAGVAGFASVGIYPDEIPLQVCFLLLMGGVGSLLCIYAVQNLLVSREFLIRIDATTIEQIVPVWGAGETFQVPLSNIDHVEKVNDDGGIRLVIVDRAENRFELTVNYGSPLRQIAEVLESLNVPVVRL